MQFYSLTLYLFSPRNIKTSWGRGEESDREWESLRCPLHTAAQTPEPRPRSAHVGTEGWYLHAPGNS